MLWFALLGLTVPLRAQVYISEFMADNQTSTLVDEDADHSDWLEIWNSGTAAVSLNGWYLTDNSGDLRKWRFPVSNPAVSLAPDGRLIIFCSSKDRKSVATKLHTNFKLSKNAGSYLALVKADGLTIAHQYTYPRQVQDITYGIPAHLQTQSLVVQGQSGKAKVPASSADMPAGWNALGFDDSTWTTGATGFGYDTSGSYGSLLGSGGNLQSAMYNVNATALIRVPFSVSNPANITALKLSMRYDDGYVCYLNGTLLTSQLAPASPTWNSSATQDRAGALTATNEIFNTTTAQSLLVSGTNVLAFQMLNNSNGSTEDTDANGTANGSRALCLPQLDATVYLGIQAPGYLASSTPGAANSVTSTAFGPIITQATDTAPRPTGAAGSAPIVVSAKVLPTLNPLNATNPVQLKWRLMQGTEQSVVMKDDGVAPDATAGDGIYTAQFSTVISSGSVTGQMFRWRIEAKDTANNVRTEPPFGDPTDNDQYYGTVTQDGITTSQVPIMHWFVASTSGAATEAGTRCSLFFLGKFYDNVFCGLHGQSSASFPKKSVDFNFSEDNRFLWQVGQEKQRALNLITTYADKSHVRDRLAWETWASTGHLASHWVQTVRMQQNGNFYGLFDMVENGDEDFVSRAGLDPMGALYKVYNSLDSSTSNVERKTRDFETSNADLQALIDGLNTSKTLLARRQYAYDNVDIPSLINYLAANTLITNNDFGHKNYYMYRDTNGTGEWSILPWDQDLSFGHTWTSSQGYFNDDIDSQRGLVFGNVNGNRLLTLVTSTTTSLMAPELSRMYLRRLRSLMDTMLVSSTATDGPFEQRINQLLDLIDPPGASYLTDADLDLQKWGYWVDGSGSALQAGSTTNDAATHDHGVRKSAARITNSNPNPPYPAATSNAEGLGDTTPTYLAGRRAKLYNGGLTLNGASIPAAQPTAPASLVIEYVEANPGNQDQEYFIIRNNSTTDYVDISGWKITGAVDYTFRGGTVIPPFTSGSAVTATGDVHAGRLHVARNPAGFRARTVSPKGGEYRLVCGGYSGQLSARGETINLVKPGATPAQDVVIATKAYTGSATATQNYLRVTELAFAPTDPTASETAALPGVQASDFEFIELANTGPLSLSLGGARFSEGVDFTFPAGFTLNAGQRCVVVALASAFQLRYGSSALVAGQYDGHFDNSGERVQLLDPVGEPILDFTYDPAWYGVNDPSKPGTLQPVKGYSLVARGTAPAWDGYDAATGWKLGGASGGTPGGDDAQASNTFAGWRKDFFTPTEEADISLSAPLADPDGDGRNNLDEFSWGGNPRQRDTKPTPVITTVTVGPDQFLAITFNRRQNPLDVIYTVEVSADFSTWTAVNLPVGSPTPLGSGMESVTYRDNVPIGSTPRFIHVKAVK